VGVNVSAVHLATGTLVDDVLGALDEHGVPAGRLVLELTETALAGNPGSARAQLAELRGHGVRIAIDDFGSGYSSLSAVASLPADVIKIDRALVSGPLPAGPAAPEAVLRAVTALGAALGMDVLAEGVETAEQLDLARTVGCTHVQGHHLSRPLPAGELADLLTAARRPPGPPHLP
jgi:EAL domain-containing protein (putative c-di-GMP-specific phosphodiesterase class I)